MYVKNTEINIVYKKITKQKTIIKRKYNINFFFSNFYKIINVIKF